MVDSISSANSILSAGNAASADIAKQLKEVISQTVLLAGASKGEALVSMMSTASNQFNYYNDFISGSRRSSGSSLLGAVLNVIA